MQDGEVDAEELQRCLTQSGFTGSYTRKFTVTVVCEDGCVALMTEAAGSHPPSVLFFLCKWLILRPLE